jgi:hypothetical protein
MPSEVQDQQGDQCSSNYGNIPALVWAPLVMVPSDIAFGCFA